LPCTCRVWESPEVRNSKEEKERRRARMMAGEWEMSIRVLSELDKTNKQTNDLRCPPSPGKI